jgi:hypothetical protein
MLKASGLLLRQENVSTSVMSLIVAARFRLLVRLTGVTINSQTVRPQHDPGPAQPASAGRLPQQPWSRGPGAWRRMLPVSVLVGDICFSG